MHLFLDHIGLVVDDVADLAGGQCAALFGCGHGHSGQALGLQFHAATEQQAGWRHLGDAVYQRRPVHRVTQRRLVVGLVKFSLSAKEVHKRPHCVCARIRCCEGQHKAVRRSRRHYRQVNADVAAIAAGVATERSRRILEQRDAKKAEAERAPDTATNLANELKLLEGALAKTAWVAGAQFSLADIALGPIVKRCIGFPLGLPASPKTQAWVAELQKRPAFQKATATG